MENPFRISNTTANVLVNAREIAQSQKRKTNYTYGEKVNGRGRFTLDLKARGDCEGLAEIDKEISRF